MATPPAGADLGVNATGPKAAIGVPNGTVTVRPGGSISFTAPAAPGVPSIVASAAGTPYSCSYR